MSYDLNKCYLAKDAKIRKARKEHSCSICNRKILPKQRYFAFNSAAFLIWYDDFEEKEIVERIYVNDKYCHRCNYKKHSHDIRAQKRKDNCPDENFQFQWNGGWCDGAPDGGDGQFECHGCNLHCH